MNNEQLERLKRRQQISKEIKTSNNKYESNNDELVSQYLNSDIDKTKIHNFEKISFDTNIDVSNSEINELLNSISAVYDKEKLGLLIKDCRNNVLSNIIKPFGIGSIIANYDKTGGNVDTVHNVRQIGKDPNMTYKDKQNEIDYTNRGDYDSKKYHAGSNFQKIKHEAKKEYQNNDFKSIKDEYTGEVNLDFLGNSKNAPANRNAELDHVVEAKAIHDDAGRVLAELDGVKLADSEDNFAWTNKSLNASMGSWAKEVNNKWKKEHGVDAPLSEVDMKAYIKAHPNLDEKTKANMLQQYEKSRQAYDAKINKKYYKSKKFKTQVVKTGAREGCKMGIQQAVGLVLKELVESIFDECMDIYKNGFRNGMQIDASFFQVFKERLFNIGNKILAKWEDVVKAFGAGFFSGFLSNLITVIMNMFFTTAKNVVRIVREGIFSLLRAIKLLFFPPEGMSLKEAAHEATKLIASGLVIAGGIVLEEVLDKFLVGVPFVNLISDVLLGLLTGLMTSLIVFLIDKWDIFGVNVDKKHEYLMNHLDQMIDKNVKGIEEILNCLEIDKKSLIEV